MVKKPKSSQCSSGWCANHILEITATRNIQCYYRKKIKLRLCPRFSKLLSYNSAYTTHFANQYQSQMMTVNTILHALSSKKKKIIIWKTIKNSSVPTMTNYSLKVALLLQQILTSFSRMVIQFMVAKHGRKKNYCSVCRIDYEDYLIHIEDFSHREQLRSNKFSKYILETQNNIKQQMQKEYVEIKLLEETNEVEKVKRMQQIIIED